MAELSHPNAIINVAKLSYYDGLIKAWVKAIANLDNYYKKSETFTQTEINNLIAGVAQFRPQVVTTLPDASEATVGKFYLLKPAGKSHYEEYVGIDQGESASPRYKLELIGDTDIKLENYYTKSEVYTKTETDDAIATAKSEAISTAAADATSKANTAKSEAIAAAATDATSKADAAQAAAEATAAADATSKANAAQAAAEATAAADATSKANAAESNAKSYADGKFATKDALEAEENARTQADSALDGRVTTIENNKVTIVASATLATDAHYPSEKAVRTELDKKQDSLTFAEEGDIDEMFPTA